jgi:murein DD-endopeptidase MepM/ murein hydrolase activator NlpD
MRTRTPNLTVRNCDSPNTLDQTLDRLANSAPIPAWGTEIINTEIDEIASLKRFCIEQCEHLQKPLQAANAPFQILSIRHLTTVWRYGIFLYLGMHLASYHSNANIPLRLIHTDTLSTHSETIQDFSGTLSARSETIQEFSDRLSPRSETIQEFSQLLQLEPLTSSKSNAAINAVNSTHQEDMKAPVPNEPTSGFINPVEGFPVTSSFGNRVHPLSGEVRFHKGIDIGTPIGTPIRAAKDGKVIFAGWSDGYGKKILIDHGNGYETLYAHLDELLVKAGDRVSSGEVIGLSGGTGYVTGPHLHFEIQLNAVARDPLNYF